MTTSAHHVAGVIHRLVDRLSGEVGPWPLMAESGISPGQDVSSFVAIVPGSPPELFDVTVTRRTNA